MRRTFLPAVAALLAATPLVGADRLCKINAMCTPNVPAGTFPNGGMAPPLVQVQGPQWEMDGWEVYNERVQLNGISTVAGFPTPDDTDVPPNCPCPMDDCPLSGVMDFESTIESADPPPTGSDTYIEFYSDGNVIQNDDDGGPNDFGYGIIHGPYMVSKSAIRIKQGAEVSFDWFASGASDDYDVFGYLLEVETGNTITLVNSYGGSTDWTTTTVPVPMTGLYKFIFISGTYDESGGAALGAIFRVTNIGINGNTLDSLEECLAACEGYGYANWVRATGSCTCSENCDDGYGPVVSGATKTPVTVNAEVYALTPYRCYGDALPTMQTKGPKALVPKGGTANLKITISGAKLASLRDLRVKQPVTSDWSVTLELPRRTRATKASTPAGVGKVGAPVITSTQVVWPRVPLKEGPTKSQRVTLSAQVMLEPTVESNNVVFNAIVTNGVYTINAPVTVKTNLNKQKKQ